VPVFVQKAATFEKIDALFEKIDALFEYKCIHIV